MTNYPILLKLMLEELQLEDAWLEREVFEGDEEDWLIVGLGSEEEDGAP